MDVSKPAQVVKDAVAATAEKAADLLTPHVPGVPGSAPAPLAERT